jgi:hypothetical protein
MRSAAVSNCADEALATSCTIAQAPAAVIESHPRATLSRSLMMARPVRAFVRAPYSASIAKPAAVSAAAAAVNVVASTARP